MLMLTLKMWNIVTGLEIIKLSKRQDANKIQQVKKNEIVEFGVDGHK